jgi:geranylgeranyl reductase family protein
MQSPDTKYYDVIICGAGPAGSTCALALAGSGLKVALIEKYNFPRDKICGDAVAAYVPKVLSSINPAFGNALNTFDQKFSVNTCRVVAPNTKFIDLSYSESGFISMRKDLDDFLFTIASEQENVTTYLDHAVSDVLIDSQKNEVTVLTDKATFKSKIVIGCDGAHSVVNKKMTTTRLDPQHYAGGVRAYFKNVSDIPDKTFELHFLKDLLPGYFWIFPLKNSMANVGIGVLSSVVSKRRMDLRKKLVQSIETVDYLKARFKGAELIGKIEGFGLPLGSRKVTISGNNFMLCGDAASLIDPLSGEGIGQAILSGRYAGWHAKKCFEHNDFSSTFMKGYDEQVYKKLWDRHLKNYRIQQIIGDREWLLNGIFNISLTSPWIKKMIARRIV